MKNQLIQSHPNIMMGNPVVAGTSTTVDWFWKNWRRERRLSKFLTIIPFGNILLHAYY